jgi:hypothetical protein
MVPQARFFSTRKSQNNKSNTTYDQGSYVENEASQSDYQTAQDEWYRPDNKLIFDKNGYCLICVAERARWFRAGSIFFAIIFFYMFQKGVRKLTFDLSNRNLFGMFWYFGIAYLGYAG